VGETEEEMMAIADFANELGVHGMTLCKLRVDEFTPLRKLVESTPGYRISPHGNVYSKEFDKKRLRQMRNRIRNRFLCRPGQLSRSFLALDRCEILTYRQMMRLGFITPLILVSYLASRGRKMIHRLRRRFAAQDDEETLTTGVAYGGSPGASGEMSG